MSEEHPQSTQLLSAADYVAALDTICGMAKHNLFIFEKDFFNTGFDSVSRIEILRLFLLSNPNNRLQLLAHDTRPISQYYPRLMSLLRLFGHNMFIYQTPRHLQHLSEPFTIADETHFVRRYHFEDTRGLLGLNSGSDTRLLTSRFTEMWQASQPSNLTATFIL